MPEEPFAFRLRYTRSPRRAINCYEVRLPLPATERGLEIDLKARDSGKTIETSDSLVLHGSGWATSEDADRAGHFYGDILARVYARLRLGADFGTRTGARGWVTEAGLQFFSQQAGRPLLNDVHGLMVYDRTSNPGLAFISTGGDVRVGTNLEQFLSVYSTALGRPRKISEQERVAIELFNASFFQTSFDGRFLLLMMAVEALIEQGPQSDEVKTIIRGFLDAVDPAREPNRSARRRLVRNKIGTLLSMAGNSLLGQRRRMSEAMGAAVSLDRKERDDLKSRLGGLQKESIRQAGCRLIREKLGNRSYNGVPAEEFFEMCYNLRSSLAHGEAPLPTSDQINGVAAPLEVMVSHLLSTDLLDVGPQQEGGEALSSGEPLAQKAGRAD